jgi:hypothetical protein
MQGLHLLALLQQPLRLLNSGQSKQVYTFWFSIIFCLPQGAYPTPQYLTGFKNSCVRPFMYFMSSSAHSFRIKLFAINMLLDFSSRSSLLRLPLNFCEASFLKTVTEEQTSAHE